MATLSDVFNSAYNSLPDMPASMAGARGFVNSLTLGASRPIGAGMMLALDQLIGEGKLTLQEALQLITEQQERDQKEHSGAALVGNLAGAVLPAIATGGGSVGLQAAKLGSQGLTQGLMNSELFSGKDNIDYGNVATDTALGGGLGTLFGAAGAGASKYAQSVIRKASERNIRQLTEREMLKGQQAVVQQTPRPVVSQLSDDLPMGAVKGSNWAKQKPATVQAKPKVVDDSGEIVRDRLTPREMTELGKQVHIEVAGNTPAQNAALVAENMAQKPELPSRILQTGSNFVTSAAAPFAKGAVLGSVGNLFLGENLRQDPLSAALGGGALYVAGKKLNASQAIGNQLRSSFADRLAANPNATMAITETVAPLLMYPTVDAAGKLRVKKTALEADQAHRKVLATLPQNPWDADPYDKESAVLETPPASVAIPQASGRLKGLPPNPWD